MRRSQSEGELGDFRLTREQFQALNLNDLHPATLEAIAIASRTDPRDMVTYEQLQALDLRAMPLQTVIALMESPFSDTLRITQTFLKLNVSHWQYKQQYLQRVLDTLSVEKLLRLSANHSDFMKELLSYKAKKGFGPADKTKAMKNIPNHGIFNQTIVDGNFVKEFIPFLRISELNADAIEALVELQPPKDTLKAIAFGDKSPELSESAFRTALKGGLEIKRLVGAGARGSNTKYVYLRIEELEALIRNPNFISREEFNKATEKNDRKKIDDKTYRFNHNYSFKDINEVYKKLTDKDVPEDFRDSHLDLFKERFRSIMGESSLFIHILK